MTLPPHRIGDMGQRFVVQTTGWPNHDAMGWQNAVFADTHEGAAKAMSAIAKCPGVKHVRIRDRIEDHPEDPEGRKLADLVEGLRADAQPKEINP
ncbi:MULTISPECIES: hypothetical protein [Alphaproteobacteria]|uniref:hypothetical protein n=1 Tax=Sphingopyxis sp. TaxID=1908224 RepID=UPI004034C9BD